MYTTRRRQAINYTMLTYVASSTHTKKSLKNP